jgi:hypothetical protein
LSLFYFSLLTVVIFIASGGIAAGGRMEPRYFYSEGMEENHEEGRGMEVLYLVIYITRV